MNIPTNEFNDIETRLLHHPVVSREEWLEARTTFLAKEKAFTRQRDQLVAERMELPWVKIDKNYVFEGPGGPITLAELFDGRSQLIIKHFMMGPGQKHQCVGCSFEVDQVEPALLHLENHDVSYVAVARAPIDEIEAFKKRMGWRFNWISSFNSDFNYDFSVSFTKEQIAAGAVYYNYRMTDIPLEDLSGHTVFYQAKNGDIFHTYSAFGRGAEETLTAYIYLEITPKGRNEPGPRHDLADWVRLHDKYGADGYVEPTGRYHDAGETEATCCA